MDVDQKSRATAAAASMPPNDDASAVYVAEGGVVWKQPIHRYDPEKRVTTITIGFPVCLMHPAAGAGQAPLVAALMNAGDQALKAPPALEMPLARSDTVVHQLKTWRIYWGAIMRYEKNFEVRRDDRGFRRGHILELQCWDHDANGYVTPHGGLTQRAEDAKRLFRRVTFVMAGGQFGVEPGFVVMGLEHTNGR